jgi:hypothetical protein
MDANDAADVIREALAEEQAESRDNDRFRSRAALVIAFLAALLAISSVGGDNAGDDVIVSNIHASDTWAFYQAKNVRQTATTLAADALESDLKIHGSELSADARKSIEARIARYRATVERYNDEPDASAPADSTLGEGKRQLSARARMFEARRTQAESQDTSFDYAGALYQIAIVLGSVSILALSRKVLAMSVVTGIAATLLTINGYFLLI